MDTLIDLSAEELEGDVKPLERVLLQEKRIKFLEVRLSSSNGETN
jgi:hypothetical protein